MKWCPHPWAGACPTALKLVGHVLSEQTVNHVGSSRQLVHKSIPLVHKDSTLDTRCRSRERTCARQALTWRGTTMLSTAPGLRWLVVRSEISSTPTRVAGPSEGDPTLWGAPASFRIVACGSCSGDANFGVLVDGCLSLAASGQLSTRAGGRTEFMATKGESAPRLQVQRRVSFGDCEHWGSQRTPAAEALALFGAPVNKEANPLFGGACDAA